MMISSAAKARSASSIATFGSASPTSPFALIPSCSISITESSIRWRASTIASSMSPAQWAAREVRLNRGHDPDFALAPAAALADRLEQLAAADGLVGDDQHPVPSVAAAGQRQVLAACRPREAR